MNFKQPKFRFANSQIALRATAWATLLSACVLVSPLEAAPKWQLPEGAKSVEVNGYDMAYQETGSGTPLVLVHGALTDYRYWYLLVPEFAKNYRVIAVALRHYYPEKWDGNGNDFSYEQHAADVAALIKKLNLGKGHLLGHSRGGGVVVNVAKAYPEVIKTLILADATGLSPCCQRPPRIKSLQTRALIASKPCKRTLQAGMSIWEHRCSLIYSMGLGSGPRAPLSKGSHSWITSGLQRRWERLPPQVVSRSRNSIFQYFWSMARGARRIFPPCPLLCANAKMFPNRSSSLTPRTI